MKLAFHWRAGLWICCLIVFAFLVFGLQRRTFAFASGASILLIYIVFHLRSQFVQPLAEISHSLQDAVRGNPMRLPIARSQSEAGHLSSALETWSEHMDTRIREMSNARLRLESVLSAMVEGVLVFDAEHRIVLANAALNRLLVAQREPVGKTCLEVFRNELLDRSLAEALNGEVPNAVEFQTGSGLTVRALLSPIRDETGGGVEAVVSVLHDVTDIRQLDRVRRDFVANVSHEFKIPLTSIRGYAETMMSDPASASNSEFIEVIYRNAGYLESLVNDLLELARLESGPPSSSEPVDIKSIVAEQVLLRERFLSAGSLKIEVDCPSMELEVDPARLSTALSNLIDNAIAYNRPAGEVRISVCREGSNVVVAVSDGGFGILDEELPRIFERFYRVDKSRARKGGGSGLGLAIARHAIESQGGSLTVESKLGSGSTFTIRLPAPGKAS